MAFVSVFHVDILVIFPWPLTVPEYTTSANPLLSKSPNTNLPSLTAGRPTFISVNPSSPFLYAFTISPEEDCPLNNTSNLPSASKSTKSAVPSLTETKSLAFSSKYTSIGCTATPFSSNFLLFSKRSVLYPSKEYPDIRKSKSPSLSTSPKS